MLAQAYNRQGSSRQCEVVFVSSDRDAGSFNGYYSEMPWTALPFGSPQCQTLGQLFGVRGIPSVVAIDRKTGQVLDREAKNAIAQSRFDLRAACSTWGIQATIPEERTVLQEAAASSAPTPKTAAPPPVAIDLAVVKQALGSVDEAELEAQETFYATLLKVLKNVLDNPTEPKFRSLKKTNAALQAKFFGVGDGAAIALLKLGGFEDGEETIGLPGSPDGRCTALRDAVQEHAEALAMARLRKERDAKIAGHLEEDKKKGPDRKFGGDSDTGRNTYGAGRKRGGGGG